LKNNDNIKILMKGLKDVRVWFKICKKRSPAKEKDYRLFAGNNSRCLVVSFSLGKLLKSYHKDI